MTVGVELGFHVVRVEEAALLGLLRVADRRRARPVGEFGLLPCRIRNSGALDVSAEKLWVRRRRLHRLRHHVPGWEVRPLT